MSKRKSIGPLYTSYPARVISDWLGDKTFKIIASIVCTLLWWGVYYVLLGVVNFNKNTFMEGATETTVAELYRTEGSMIFLGISSAIVCVFVFRSRIGSSPKQNKRR
jgi:hypothetical protein